STDPPPPALAPLSSTTLFRSREDSRREYAAVIDTLRAERDDALRKSQGAAPRSAPAPRSEATPATGDPRRGVALPRTGQDESDRSEEHTSELQSLTNLVCRLL